MGAPYFNLLNTAISELVNPRISLCSTSEAAGQSKISFGGMPSVLLSENCNHDVASRNFLHANFKNFSLLDSLVRCEQCDISIYRHSIQEWQEREMSKPCRWYSSSNPQGKTLPRASHIGSLKEESSDYEAPYALPPFHEKACKRKCGHSFATWECLGFSHLKEESYDRRGRLKVNEKKKNENKPMGFMPWGTEEGAIIWRVAVKREEYWREEDWRESDPFSLSFGSLSLFKVRFRRVLNLDAI